MRKVSFKGFFGNKKGEPKNNKNPYLTILAENNTPLGWSYSDVDRERLAQYITSEEYGNGVVFSIVSSIADTAAELFKFVELIEKNGEVIEDAEQVKHLLSPNDADTQTAMIRQIMLNLLTVGDAFVFGLWNNVANRRSELYVIPSEKMEIVTGGITAPIKGYRYKGTLKAETDFNNENTLFIRLPNISNSSYYGLSPLTPIRKDLEALDTAKRLQNKLFKEGGVRNLICLDSLPDGENIMAFIDTVSEQLNSSKGKTNQVYYVPLRRVPLGDSSADLALQEEIRAKTEVICNAYAYPTNLFYRDSTFSNLAEAKREKYTITIPYVNMLCEAFSDFLLTDEQKKNGVKFALNTDQVEELKPDYADFVTAMGQILTKNEMRAFWGYPPVDGGDVMLEAIGKMPLTEIVSTDGGESDNNK